MDERARRLRRIRQVRDRLREQGPPRLRAVAGDDFSRVTLPEADCDALRDLLVAENVATVVEVGLAYGRSALAVGEALVAAGRPSPSHLLFDPFQHRDYRGAGWEVLRDAGLDDLCTLFAEPSQIGLPRLLAAGRTADAAFVDGSHHFHSVFVDLYFLRDIVRPGGLVVLDDHWTPSVASAARYYETNLGWARVPGPFEGATADAATGHPRVAAFRLPDPVVEPPFTAFVPF